MLVSYQKLLYFSFHLQVLVQDMTVATRGHLRILFIRRKVELISNMCGFIQKIITVDRVQINSFKHTSSPSALNNVASSVLCVVYSVHEMSHCMLFLTHSVSTFQHLCGVYSVLHFFVYGRCGVFVVLDVSEETHQNFNSEKKLTRFVEHGEC